MVDDAIAAVNENADKARKRDRDSAGQISAKARVEMEKSLEAAAKKGRRLRKKATRQFVLRAVAAVVVCTLFWLAGFFGLMDARLTMPIMGTVGSWLGFWLGAWVQFMWADGGLLNVNAE